MKPSHTSSATLLPPIWEQNYNVSHLLSIYTHDIIYELTEQISGEKYILKILDKKYYHKKLYQTLSSSGCNFLLLPIEVTEDSQFVYFIYEYCPCLTELLLVREFSYAELSIFVQDIGNAILFLHENHITHRDIAPGNIFMNENGHFLLGDFSSSLFESKSSSPSSDIIAAISDKARNFGCRRTGSTPFFSPPDYLDRQNGYYIDIYGFAMLLFLLLNELKPPTEDDFARTCSSPILKLLLAILTESNSKEFPDFQAFFYQLTDMFQNTAAENLTFHTAIIKHENTDFFLRTASLNDRNSRTKKPAASSSAKPADSKIQQSQCKQQSKNLVKTAGGGVLTKNRSQPKLSILLYGFLLLSVLLFSIPFYRSLTSRRQEQTNITQSFLSEQDKKIFMNKQNLTSVDFLQNNHSVEILVLSENNISSVKPLSKLTQLLILDLSCNQQLMDILSLTDLQNLQQLILTDTNITQEEHSALQNALPDCIILY